MFGAANSTGRPNPSHHHSVAPRDPERVSAALAHTLSAPVGLIDPSAGGWIAFSGGPPATFPRIEEVLRHLRAEAQSGVAPPVATWHPDPSITGGTPTVWLLMNLATPLTGMVALAGFRDAQRLDPRPDLPWGPPCPEPALIAWGREIRERLKAQGSRSSVRAPMSSAQTSEGGEGVILARLIRRMRLSDAPERFQHLACNALRSTLGVQVVAWIPCQHSEPVVTSGEVAGIHAEGYRVLIPTGPAVDPIHVWNEPDSFGDPNVRRVIAAAADSQRPMGWLIAVNSLDDRPFRISDAELLQPVASVICTQQNHARGYADLKELLFGVIRSLTSAIDAKDPYTSGHSERVARIAVRLSEELGVPPAQRSDLYLMGLLHDVGKIGVDDAVLKKAGPLTPDEYRQIQKHVEIGVQILADLKKLGHLLPGVRHHHESLDGTGYPDGLAGDAIPFEARILAVADSYDAMSSTRPYRRRLTPSQIDEIFHKGSGSQWDPRVVDAMFACRLDLETIRQKGLGESLQAAVSGALGRA
ncbi:MAG: HD-GYP domain-containing protein [Isosphaeraceae bacterium]